MSKERRILLGIFGASDAIYAVRLLQMLAQNGVCKTRLHLENLRLMTQAAERGAVIAPPIPAFYHQPGSIEDLVQQYICRMVDWPGLLCPPEGAHRW